MTATKKKRTKAKKQALNSLEIMQMQFLLLANAATRLLAKYPDDPGLQLHRDFAMEMLALLTESGLAPKEFRALMAQIKNVETLVETAMESVAGTAKTVQP